MSGRPVRSDPVDDFGTTCVLSRFEIVVRLEVHPELWRSPEIPSETKTGISGDGPPAANDIVDASHRRLQFDCEATDRKVKRFEKVLPQRFAIFNRTSLVVALGDQHSAISSSD